MPLLPQPIVQPLQLPHLSLRLPQLLLQTVNIFLMLQQQLIVFLNFLHKLTVVITEGILQLLDLSLELLHYTIHLYELPVGGLFGWLGGLGLPVTLPATPVRLLLDYGS